MEAELKIILGALDELRMLIVGLLTPGETVKAPEPVNSGEPLAGVPDGVGVPNPEPATEPDPQSPAA